MALHGDGGVMFTIAELAAAAELRLALPLVVVDNGGYGEIRNEMADLAIRPRRRPWATGLPRARARPGVPRGRRP